MRKKVLSILTLFLIPIVAFADKSGICGDNLTWTLVESTGTLTISGSESMTDYNYFASTPAPWYDDRANILTVVIDDGVTSIGSYAFYDCSNLTSVTIPNSVTKIGNSAFEGSSITSIEIPNGITNIDSWTFRNCSSLASITIPNTVTNIGEFAFADCSSLPSITIPNSVTTIEDWAFQGCSSLSSIIVDGDNPVYDSREGCNAIINTDDNELIVGCMNTTIPNNVTSLKQGAFYGCSGLTYINIPNSVTNIGWNVFNFCSSLRYITIPKSVTSIGRGIFNGCSLLTSISVESDNPVYDSREGCNAIISTDDNELIAGCTGSWIPNSVTSIGDHAFSQCIGLNYIFIPNSVTSIGETAFYGCIDLGTITIPNSVTSIGAQAFKNCSNLTSITLGNNVTCIGYQAFDSCTGLTSITIPNSITSIGGSMAFSNCTSLTSITIPNNMTFIEGGAFYGCSNLTKVTVYAPSCSLGTNAFMNCPLLENIYVFNNKVSWYTTNWSTYSSKIKAITLTANEGAMGEYWATYYNYLSHVKTPSGIQVFKVALTGSSLELTEITDGIITMGEGVVLKSNTATIMPEYSETESATSYDDNDLDGTMTSIENPGNAYVLNKKDAGVGFYKLSATGTIGANKAYLTYDGSAGARGFFSLGDITGIGIPTMKGYDTDAVVYDLQGRCIAQPTKGLYIMNSKKVFINK